MSNNKLSDTVAEIVATVKGYINTRIDLVKLAILEKSSLTVSLLLTAVIIVIITAFLILFLTLAFSYWYGEKTGDIVTGFLISAGFYLLLAVFLFFNRKNFVTGPVIRAISEILFDNDDAKGEDDGEA